MNAVTREIEAIKREQESESQRSYARERKESLELQFSDLCRTCLQHSHPVELLTILRDECMSRFGTLGLLVEEQLDAAILNLDGAQDGPVEVTPQEVEDRRYYVINGRAR